MLLAQSCTNFVKLIRMDCVVYLLTSALFFSETSSDRCSSVSSSSNMDTRREDFSPLLPPSLPSINHPIRHQPYYYRLTHALFPCLNVSGGGDYERLGKLEYLGKSDRFRFLVSEHTQHKTAGDRVRAIP